MTVGELILSIPEEIKEEVFRNFEFCILYIRMAVILVNQPDERLRFFLSLICSMISTGIRSFEELVFQLYQKSSLSPSSSFVQQYGEEILVSDYRKRIRDVVLSAITACLFWVFLQLEFSVSKHSEFRPFESLSRHPELLQELHVSGCPLLWKSSFSSLLWLGDAFLDFLECCSKQT